MHPAQRLALLVLADAVEVEAGRAPEQEPAAVLGVRAALGEEPVERDEPRVDEQRASRVELDVHAREPERVVDRRARLLDDVAAARHALEHVRAAVAGAGARRASSPASPRRAIVSVTRSPAAGIRDSGWTLETDPDVVALEQTPLPARRRSVIGPAGAAAPSATAASGASTSPVATG